VGALIAQESLRQGRTQVPDTTVNGRVILGTVAFWHGSEIVTQVLWFQFDNLSSQMDRAALSLEMLNRDKLPCLCLSEPRYYPSP